MLEKNVVNIFENSFSPMKELTLELGLSSSIVSLGQTTFYHFMKTVMIDENVFSNYLRVIRSCSVKFHYQFIELSSVIATQLAFDLDVTNRRKNVEQIVFAAMFCDITLRKSEWIHIRSPEQLKGLSGLIIKEINMHALKASELAFNSKFAPEDAWRIIRHHHADLNGLGFGKSVDENFCAMTKCLMTAQEIAYTILMNPGVSARALVADTVQKLSETELKDHAESFEGHCRSYYGKVASC
ncbi:hypothetical protein [Peredibacter starrii]|uniref:Uncharacterized protein n=1 Tax=Peredibacter starrii TaxID=28202 RepID=A0AAX4HPA0_9BACT|nr:hypothetical protein [Peredibacter starrii]WPU65074.1 hypothetical protein SOO65_20465 [Peredibacter starrii]